MSYETRFPDWRKQIEEASDKTQSASAAAAYLSIKYDTYKRYAKKYGCFKTNQGLKGSNKPKTVGKISLESILRGEHPQYQSNKLRLRLLKEEIFPHICSSCLTERWLDELVPLELDHIDGNSTNHKLENLRLLCPNCHALTSTYRGKNKGLVAE